RRPGAASGGAQDGRTGQPQGRSHGEERDRARRQAPERGGGELKTKPLLAVHDNKSPKETTHRELPAAKSLGEEGHPRVACQRARAAAESDARRAGLGRALAAAAATSDHMRAEPLAALIVSLAPPYNAIVAPATTTGKNVLPRVAALLDVMQISDIVKVIAPN